MTNFGLIALIIVIFCKCILVPARSVVPGSSVPCAKVPRPDDLKPFEVTLDVYSGVSNPTWTVSPSDNLHQTLVLLLSDYESTPVPSILGYRGFKIHGNQNSDSGLSQSVAAGSNRDLEFILLYTGLSSDNPSTSEIVQELLCQLAGSFASNTYPSFTSATSSSVSTGPSSPSPTDLSATPTYSSTQTSSSSSATTWSSSQTTSSVTPGSQPTTPKPCNGSCPTYRPGKWNNNPNDKAKNNCYNYATNSKTGTFAKPGRGSGSTYTSLTGAAVKAAAMRDGLKVVANPASVKNGECLVALVIWPGRDFHWYRQDQNGNWSHKPGSTAATNLDNSGNVITDPRTADTGNYKFVTFMSYCPGQIKVRR